MPNTCNDLNAVLNAGINQCWSTARPQINSALNIIRRQLCAKCTANVPADTQPTDFVQLGWGGSLPDLDECPVLFVIEGSNIWVGVNGADLQQTASDWRVILPNAQSTGHPSLAASGRLSLVSGDPTPTNDVTAASTLYFVPYNGSHIGVYSGSEWVLVPFTQKSIAVPNERHQLYDVFVYLYSQTIELELTAWNPTPSGIITNVTNASPMVVTSADHGLTTGEIVTIHGVNGATGANGTWRVGTTTTNTFQLLLLNGSNSSAGGAYSSGGTWTAASRSSTRAVDLVYQDGVLVRSGAPTRRYIGTIRTTATPGQTESSSVRRLVYNVNNQRQQRLTHRETTGTWTVSSLNALTFVMENNSAANRVEFVNGVSELVEFWYLTAAQSNSGGSAYASLGVDSLTRSETITNLIQTGITSYQTLVAAYQNYLAPGYHFVQKGNPTNVTTANFIGTTETNTFFHRCGLIGYVNG